jgi:hypothetical protein
MKSLKEHVDRLLTWIEPSNQVAWTDLRIVELQRDEVGAPILRLPAVRLKKIDEYEMRFSELIGAGYSWINLSCYGIASGVMIVTIELPSRAVGFAAGRTPVNISGPPGGKFEQTQNLIML